MRSLLHGLLCVIGLASPAAGEDAKTYGAKVTFRQGEPLRFPDFELVYTGKRHVVPPQFPRGWWAYDFTAKQGNSEEKISWSAGTGDIGPTRFRMGGAAFDLELSRSDKLGRLKEDELVVTRAR